jgi:hypothetical protein
LHFIPPINREVYKSGGGGLYPPYSEINKNFKKKNKKNFGNLKKS